jgi:hypothetical protein
VYDRDEMMAGAQAVEFQPLSPKGTAAARRHPGMSSDGGG